jgi:hypothetical protein
MNQTYTPANIQDKETSDFIKALLQSDRSAYVTDVDHRYSNNHVPTEVLTINTQYPYNECWFNAIHYATQYANNQVRPVFGWAIWRFKSKHFVAQHHAVVDVNGVLTDVSLNKHFGKILFVPDHFAPFDFYELRYPFNFESINGENKWFAEDITNVKFSIAKMMPKPNQTLDRERKIVIDGIVAGII